MGQVSKDPGLFLGGASRRGPQGARCSLCRGRQQEERTEFRVGHRPGVRHARRRYSRGTCTVGLSGYLFGATSPRHERSGPGCGPRVGASGARARRDRKSTRLNSSHLVISYAVFCLKKKKKKKKN